MTDTNVPVIEMRDISKKFGEFYANKNINLQLKKGEIHALLGENGAGKSTLMNILSGLLEPTSGDIYMGGEVVQIDSPTKANQLGIGMVHQHFMLIDAFTVVENIILGEEPVSGLTIDKGTAQKKIEEISQQYGLSVDPSARISSISVGMQQRVEILKVLYRGADILIFDEPTASLTPQEVTDLMVTLRKLAEEGKSIIIITHKLDEIKQVADRCTVIRRGQSIDTVDVATTTSNELADMMVGRSVSFTTEKKLANPSDTIIDIKSLNVLDERSIKAVEDLSFKVRKGEIVGVAGIDGNGQSELILAMTGLLPVESGQILFEGKDITGLSPRDVNESGIAHIPEDRHKYGLILDMQLESNMILKNYYAKPYSSNGLLHFTKIEQQARKLIESYDVRTTSEKAIARSLSGGNQQKAIIAREIDSDPKFLIAANPTRGLDVGAIEFIHKELINERDKDKGVLLMSFELDEILNVTDRVLVMFDGKIVADIPTHETNERELGLMMAGTPFSEIEAARQEGSVV
ncbi:MAG: ABC transporter ATP-binding protein [Ruoffia tabacinasalis]|uniref:ABC transporter ATP-binding protein n=1 Tax=unclassified Ruoffia TaxID=2862149 RepID=UPI000EBE431E|nr:heme ABC transporter ATP-binding protein [Aerococcaceae bacterium]